MVASRGILENLSPDNVSKIGLQHSSAENIGTFRKASLFALVGKIKWKILVHYLFPSPLYRQPRERFIDDVTSQLSGSGGGPENLLSSRGQRNSSVREIWFYVQTCGETQI